MNENISYNFLLGIPWVHEMWAVSSTLHNCLNFEYGHIHTMVAYLEPYALWNLAYIYIDILDIHHINLFDVPQQEPQFALVKEKIEVKVMETSLVIYKIQNWALCIFSRILDDSKYWGITNVHILWREIHAMKINTNMFLLVPYHLYGLLLILK